MHNVYKENYVQRQYGVSEEENVFRKKNVFTLLWQEFDHVR